MHKIQLIMRKSTKETAIYISGELTTETASKFTKDLPELENVNKVVLDCEKLSLLDGTGLMALSVFFSHLAEKGVNVLVSNLSGQPLELFKSLDLYDSYCKERKLKITAKFSTKLVSLFKRMVDLTISLIVLSVFIVPGLLLCIFIRLESPGSPIFKQIRVKKHTRSSYKDLRKPDASNTFAMYKFRTMRKDAEQLTGAITALENDFRVTRIGKLLRKTRLDEIPNFFNVLIGDMSVVGPRPDQVGILEQASKIFPLVHERMRFVKLGITGLAQLELRSNGTLSEDNHKLTKSLPPHDKDKPANEYRFKLYYESAYILLRNNFIRFLRTELWILFMTPITMFFKHNTI